MDVFDLRQKLVSDYERYTQSFIKIADPDIDGFVKKALQEGEFWPDPLLQLNPTFKPGRSVDDLVESKLLHPECANIFRIKSDADPAGMPLQLHTHQSEAIERAAEGKSYVLTSGTGSGKSLAYIIPIVNHVLRRGPGQGIQAIVVYPMNALANSQQEELKKFLHVGYGPGKEPVRFARFTGQERGAEREAIRENPPDILLTNYMMLELMLTRIDDHGLINAAKGLRFLVFDELHTYRGRQGADIALLIRRCRHALGAQDLICVGTSATIASGGNSIDQRNEVAKVATDIFGVEITSDRVIVETLERSTPDLSPTDPAVLQAMRDTILEHREPPANFNAFATHPISSWIESTFGLRTEQDTGMLVRQQPRSIHGPNGAAKELAGLTQTDQADCATTLRAFLLKGSSLFRSGSSRFPIFAFRLHQFVTRGDTVWASLEPQGQRRLSLKKLLAKPGESETPMFPVVFCRHCGASYYRVGITRDQSGKVLKPRETTYRVDGQEDIQPGYLYVNAEKPWPRTTGDELLERLPTDFKEMTTDDVERIIPEKKKDLPEPVFVDPTGRLVSDGDGMPTALIQDDFNFCLHCQVAYARNQKSERTKLLTLGVDSRSTATTILALRALIELQKDTTLKPEARKLLSFTDNRQDASLQAGHFNDFAQVALLRSALYRALSQHPQNTMSHGDLSREVVKAMALPFDEYASDPDVRGLAETQTDDALRRVVEYYLYRDLQRGWRVTAPNLEECGLLIFGYGGLDGEKGLLGEKDLWDTGFKIRVDGTEEKFIPVPDALKATPVEKRREIVITFLDVLRKSLAVKVDSLDPNKQRDLVDQTRPRLQEGTVWFLEDPMDLVKSQVAYPGHRPKPSNAKRKQFDRGGFYLSSYGGFGKYLRRSLRLFDEAHIQREDIDAAILFLFLALKRYGIVEQVRSGDVPGFQINPAAMLWTAGDGKERPLDRTRMLQAGEAPPEVNAYFVDYYRHFVDLKVVLEGREHTAQVAPEVREDREQQFRVAELPLLFCSPTMELGVDISQLNVVNLRNVPPTPANYAQRSGRAGRGGQPALVYTYCAGRSPHDQYYFRQPGRIVAGAVAPPRIDLFNQNLVRSHVFAVWMEVAKPDLGKTLLAVLDIEADQKPVKLPVKPALMATLKSPVHRSQARVRAQKLIDSIGLNQANAPWYYEGWLDNTLAQVPQLFDQACERWRSQYRAAVVQREMHHKIIGDHTRTESERQHSKRLRDQAETQVKLLTETGDIMEGDYYSYRYFATEGFLPGYNFPRLPLTAFVPGRRGKKGQDEFVSRPRFLAISEFGPRALVYHEGARYRVYKVNLDFGADEGNLVTYRMKRCTACGYGHEEHGQSMSEVCECCGKSLSDGKGALLDDLVLLQNVSLRLAQRITCDEEERQRYGYRLCLSYRFSEVAGKLDRRDAEVVVGDTLIMRLAYGDAATLYRINLGWSQNKKDEPDGFMLDLERGYWAKNPVDNEDPGEGDVAKQQRVIPFVTDTKNALVIRPDPALPPAEAACLQAALKEAIQKHFQVESRELSVEPLPDFRDRREFLYYEASEGGAGILRQIVEDPTVLPKLARTALEICHFDPDTLEDKAADTCGKACYACLLDYMNQIDHAVLDRNLIKDYLKRLMGVTVRSAGGTGTRAERLVKLRRLCESKLEEKWLDLLEQHSLRLPSGGQQPIPADNPFTRPDFYYADATAAIYIDGPPHDEPAQIKEDEQITKKLIEAGYLVIRFHHKADWNQVLREHPDIFGAMPV